ncbi:MFS family permease [Luteibacter sp. Sphag1AF]|uniref:MFS transporter n=1 Tax=Luteibacter sp. Sphag1AF TaxID=2587031 RepID=UPI00160D9970|nr:MFS transporter [Luteibacter sp. Sphag1AF]MBB3229160.1 MFS family permease [Luteibacter sp. Sphag1AF]
MLSRDFTMFRTGQFLASLGGRCSFLSLSWWILASTGSKQQFAELSLVFSVASFVSLPLLAPLADRWARKNLALLADAIVLAGIGLLFIVCRNGVYRGPETAAVVAILACGTSLMAAVSSSLLPTLVRREQLGPAVAITGALQALVLLVAPPLAGLASDQLGLQRTLQVTAALLVATLWCTWGIRSDTRPDERSGQQAWTRSLVEGGHLAVGIRPEFTWNLIGATINGCVVPFSTLVIPVIVVHDRGLGLAATGWLPAAVAGGVLSGNRLATPLSERVDVRKATVASILAIAVGVVTFAAPFHMWALAVGAWLCGCGMGIHNVYCASYRLAATPASCRGRLSAWSKWTAQAGMPVGLGIFGVLAQHTSGAVCSLVISGIVAATAVALALSRSISELLQGRPSDREDFYLVRYPLAFGISS